MVRSQSADPLHNAGVPYAEKELDISELALWLLAVILVHHPKEHNEPNERIPE